ncbi:small integral membrane protein 26 [Perognathus longimembris pacificus]|uniref:small integral membrane protein 26 n=1 Tax=Perognathus longimembris pacificus TaxID=214514 RepID=UPI0020189C8A|nr:small integral membrane protein 26 [Perognathus longimembris pacificus]
MRPQAATVWYRRMSLVYAFGTWSVLGSVFYLGRKVPSTGDEVEQKDDSTNEIPVSTTEKPELPKGFYVETIVTYKKDFVPVTDKIINYFKSWTGGPRS